MDINHYLKLYLILETSLLRLPLDDFIAQAIDGGVTAVQLRDKSSTAIERFTAAKSIKRLIAGKDVIFIINNTADIAVAVGANGVHLGPDDLPPGDVKKYFPNLCVGVSCNNNNDCATANSSRADYAGVGPVFFTTTKVNLRPPLGCKGVKKTTQRLVIPSVAVGGITEGNIFTLKDSGVVGVAVSSAICSSEVPYEAARALRKKLDEALK